MAQPPTRNILGIIFKNFINSFKPRQIRGTFVGTDYFGNKYYEIPANPSIGKRKASRWFDPPEAENFEQERPAEWDAWLRGRRTQPPEESEVLKNLAIMQMKKENAAKLEAKYAKESDTKMLGIERRGPDSFPKYDEFEIQPGKPLKRH